MKQIRLVLTIVLGTVFSLSASAQTVLTEQFQDYATGPLGSVGTGATGGVPGWNTSRSHIVVTNGSGSLDGTALGLVASAGDRVFIANTANTNDDYDLDTPGGHPNGCYNTFANKNQPFPAFPGTNAANLYTSFLYQFDDNTNIYTNGASTIAIMHRENSGLQTTPDASYWRLFARSNSVNTVQLGICKNPYATGSELSGGPTNWDPTPITVGQPVFVVVRLQIVATNSTSYYSNDEADLWINPAPNTFGTNEANVPAPDVSLPAGVGSVDASTTGPGRFAITDNGPKAEFDELRIATNWAEVTPPFGQCLTASVTTNPTNITQVAEINARFTVKAANSTAPTYQWQLSQNGGTTWTNINGANQNIYTTPNLQLATDNGNKYRAIVSVACDGSSATSSVATVTLTAPTVTPSPSTVMNDTFPSSSFRDVGPVTSTHSVWFTSGTSPYSSSDLVTDPNGTGLIATPISGSSSLFLGYFVNLTPTSRLPVDLAIGTQIIATLNFIPNSFNAFTNNGSLRFGLFDTADASSTNYTADDPSLEGSLGNGLNMRGYMLDLDFGKFFSTSNPLSLYVRNGVGDNDLMGATGDYLSLGSGPFNGAYSNVAAFQAGTTYTLTLTVARTATNNCTLTASITGGSLNLTYSGADTNMLGYHRFDTIAVRDNKLENAADTFTFPLFNVQVANAPVSVSSVPITSIKDVFIGATTNVTTNSVTLTWQPSPAANASLFFVQRKDNSLTDTWSTVVGQLPATVTNWTDRVTNTASFYRVYGQ
ncbi:MAG TPA: hypothetical protein VMA35_15405 [Candidatus Sulfopaludibacter sp.]|nr:hypothetical protein [Candidatus Sulfopaludibacter sp.]